MGVTTDTVSEFTCHLRGTGPPLAFMVAVRDAMGVESFVAPRPTNPRQQRCSPAPVTLFQV